MIISRKGLTRELYVSIEESLESFAEQSIVYNDYSKRSLDNDRSLPYDSQGRQSKVDDKSSRELLEEDAIGGSLPMFEYKNAWSDPQWSDFRFALFSGPHGRGISVGDYGSTS